MRRAARLHGRLRESLAMVLEGAECGLLLPRLWHVLTADLGDAQSGPEDDATTESCPIGRRRGEEPSRSESANGRRLPPGRIDLDVDVV